MAKPAPSRVAAALDYWERLKNQAAEFGGGVVENLADRARSVGGLAYEGLLHRLYANSPTPRIDQAAQDLGTIGRAIVTQPIQTGKAIVQGEIDRAQGATTSPRAAGEYAGSFIDPMRIAAALRKTAPVLELDVYHGTPHRFPATEANPLGEFDASKIGTGEGAQAYGHGVYLAENPRVAGGYQKMEGSVLQSPVRTFKGQELQAGSPQYHAATLVDGMGLNKARKEVASWIATADPRMTREAEGWKQTLDTLNAATGKADFKTMASKGSLYKADLPDEMIDRMLDWDKPLSEQPAEVRKLFPSLNEATAIDAEMTRLSEAALTANDINSPAQAAWDAMYKSPRYKLAKVVIDEANPKLKGKFANGDEIYRAIGGGNDKVASETLRSLGIPGIRYLDAGSRGQGDGTRNFVVFPGEEKKVRILERDGQKAPPQKIAQALEAAPSKNNLTNAQVEIDIHPLRSDPNTLYLSKIAVPKERRGQGFGSQAMQDIVDKADAEGKKIVLSPSTEYGATSVNRLKEFYKRFGFVENKGRNKNYAISETMYREPKRQK